MNKSEIDKLHKSIATDFKIAARKTEFWTIPYCYEILHDLKKFMLFGYLESISLVMNNYIDVPVKVKKYIIGTTSRSKDDRPGNIDWEDGEGKGLIVVLMHNQTYLSLPADKKIMFQKDHLKIPWSPVNIDVNFPHLSQTPAKMYTHITYGVDRMDFN